MENRTTNYYEINLDLLERFLWTLNGPKYERIYAIVMERKGYYW